MNSLKRKLTFSYGLLIALILLVSAWGIYHLVKLGRAIDVILVNNYKSISATENMQEALARQDSSALLFIAGHTDEARQEFAASDEMFSREFQITENNITESGENQIIADIKARYSDYSRDLKQFLDADANKSFAEQSGYYFDLMKPGFLALKSRLDDLLRLNQQAMLAANERAISESWRAEISAGVLAAIALGFALIFAWRFTDYIFKPVSVLTERARRIGEGDFDQHIDISTKDEIGILASEFNRMAARLRAMRQSDYWRMLLERKKSDAVIDSIYEPVIVTDAQGRITKLNRAASDLFGEHGNGGSKDDDISLSGFSAGERILRAVRDAVTMQKAVAAEGEAGLVHNRAGGVERSFQLRTTPMRDSDGRLIGTVTVLEDITAMRAVDQLKTGFISVASAKLREPLRSLRLALHSVIEGYTGALTAQQTEMLMEARQNAEQLDEIMSDLLELAEIESGARRISAEALRPVDLARAALDRFQAAAESKHVKLVNDVWPDLPPVVADRQAVKRIFDNLLSNAIRHTERDGQVTIGATEISGRVMFSVDDMGEGIPEEYLPRIFDRFIQVSSLRGGGTGLGLALVKRLVEAQGGRIRVESRVGEGTTFTFTLPTGRDQGAAVMRDA
ncbi:MAG: ATP-binding protein [Blastocatellia bacterium]|nr:ATP-binding protein [Blastocatellia bacterium]